MLLMMQTWDVKSLGWVGRGHTENHQGFSTYHVVLFLLHHTQVRTNYFCKDEEINPVKSNETVGFIIEGMMRKSTDLEETAYLR